MIISTPRYHSTVQVESDCAAQTLTQMEQFRRCGAIIYVLDSQASQQRQCLRPKRLFTQETTESYVKEIKKMCSIARAIEEAGQSHSISFEVCLLSAQCSPVVPGSLAKLTHLGPSERS